MADDIQSNIRINVDTASAMDSIRLLQNQISAFHTQMSKMGAASAADSRNLQQNLVNSINATGAFAANMTKVRTTAEQFSLSLERNKLSMGEYFRYAGGASKSFGRMFKAEFETINKVARERVKDLQSQYIKLGRDANGAMQAIRVRPLVLDMDNLATKTQIAAQRQQLLNQLLKQGSTNLLNFGKNTQWAGRQLMVGFTIPLSIMGSAAMKSYKEIEEAGIRLKRVYGDLGTTNMETEKMVKQVQMLAQEYTKYGVAVKDSMEMAATAAATGKKGADLLAQVSSSARLAVLGGVDQQMALKTTISLTDAFGVSAKQLSKDINFLNAVENQTVLSIEDMTVAIPKAAPVIQQLGGDVKDLAFFLTAMKEGGINASESANALKSGLASLINPTNTASKMLQGFGINLRGIVQGNKGDVKKTVIDFAQALDKLDPLNRAKAIEQLFGKFQFARMSTLFKNVIEQGSQASEVLKLASTSSLELSMLAQKELNKIQQSPLYKFQKAIADFQAQLAPVGEQFMKALTPIINFGTDVLKNFNNLGEGVKGFIVKFVAVAGVVGPVLLMSFGLIANAVANVIKGFALMKDIFNKTGKSSMSLGDQVNYMTNEQIQAAAIASSLDQVHSKLKQTFTSEAAAVDALTAAYQRSVAAQRAFGVPITPRGPVATGPVRKYATGGFITGAGTGTSDSIPAMLSNGEAVIPAKSVSQNRDLVQSLINDSIPRFASGGIIGTPSETLMQQVKGTSAVIAYGAHQPFTSAHQGIAQRGMSMAEESGMPFFQFTSNQGKAKRSVLGDDLKSRMISEAIGRNPEFAKNPFELMAILSKAGIKNVNILLGEDRMKSPVWEAAAKEFGITITKTGIPRPLGSTSGTMARAAAASGNFGMLEPLLASGMSKSTKDEIFKTLFAAGKGKKFAFGGMVRGPGGPKDDLVPANLSNGEAVIDAETTRKNPRIIGALFAGKKINIPGYAEDNSELFGFEMPDRITQKNAKRVREALDAAKAVSEDVLGGLTQSLNNITKFTQKNIDEVLYSPEFELLSSMTAAKQGRSTGSQGMVKAHGTLTREVSAQDVAPFMDPGQNALLSQASKINAMNNLTFGMPASFNKGQLTGLEGSKFIKEFQDDFMSQLAAQGLDTNDPASRAFANNVAQQMERAGAKVIGDSEFAEIVSIAINQEIDAVGKNVNQGVRKVFAEARKTSTMQYTIPGTPTARMNVPTSGRGRSANGITTIGTGVMPYRSIPLLDNAHQRADIFTAKIIADRFKKDGNVAANAFLDAQKVVLSKPANDPAMLSRDAGKRNSPHQQAPIDGKDDGVAYSQARTNAIAQEEAKSATRRNRRVTSGGIITPGESQAQQVQRTRGNRVASQGESFVPGSMIIVNPKDVVPAVNTSSSPTIIPANQNFKKSVIPAPYDTTNMNLIEKQGLRLKYGQGFQGKMFGTSMGLGMASMFLPPELGAIAQAGSMATGVAGMFKDAGPKLGEALFKFGKPLLRLVPYVGAAVVAFEVFDTFIVPMVKKNADAYKAITDTLSITQEKLQGINNFFGTDVQLTGIRAMKTAGGTQSARQASIAKQFQESQDFKDTYQESAKKMEGLSDKEFSSAMQFMAADLFGQGYEAEAVTAIVDAIALEAKKSRVSIAPELFSLDNEQTRALMNKNIEQVLNTAGEIFERYEPGEYMSPQDNAMIKATQAQAASYMSSLSGQFESGAISAEDYNTQYEKFLALSQKVPDGMGLYTLQMAFAQLNSEIGNTLFKLDELQFGIVSKAINAGVTPTAESAKVFEYGTDSQVKAQVELYNEAYKKRVALDSKIDKTKAQLKAVENSTQDIANLEGKINDKYDKRIDQLDKIKTLNDQIAKSQQGQLTLAEALNKGDIAAAARAAIDIQNNDIQASLDNQKTGLDEARKAELKPLEDSRQDNTAAVDKLTTKIQDLISKGITVQNLPPRELDSVMTPEERLKTQGIPEWLIPVLRFFNLGKAPTGESGGGGLASGGHITGPGSGTSDSIPAMLSNGEYVIRANAVKTIGVDTLNKLNQADRLGFAAGGIVDAMKGKKPPRTDQYPNVDPIDPKSVAAYRERIAKLFKPTPRKEDPTWFDWTGGKQSMLAMLDDTGNYPGYYQWTAPYAVGGSFNKTKTGPSAYTWADSPFQKYNPLNSMETNKKLFSKLPEAFPNPAANQNPLDIIEAYKKMLEGRKRLAENVYLPDLNKDTTLMTSKNPILYTIATYAKAFSNRGIYTDSTGGQDLEKARALIELGRTSKMIPGWDGLDPKEFKNLVDAMHSEFGPQVTKGMIGKLGFGKRYDRLINPPKGPSAKLNYAENYLGISGGIPKDSPIYQYAYNYMTNDYEGGERGRQNWFRGSPNSFVLNPKLGTYNRLGGYNGFAKGGMVGCPCGTPGCPGCSKGYAMGGMVGYANGGLVGYKDGGKVKKSRGYPGAFNVTSSVGQQQAERNRLYKQGGFQGFEAGANSFMADLMGGPAGEVLKNVGKFIEANPGLNLALSTLSLPVNLLGGAVRGSMNAGRALAKGDFLGAATSGFRGLGDAFASTYGNIFDKENVYKSQFEMAAQDVINNGEFGSKNNKELQALARIIGGTGDLAFDPLNYVGIGLASKAVKATSFAKNAGKSVAKAVKPVKTVTRDAIALAAAKKFELQTKNIPPLINPGKGTRASLEAAERMASKMNLGKNMKVDIKTAITDDEMAEMFDIESQFEVPEYLYAGLQGSFRNTKAPGTQGMAGNVSGVIYNKDGVLSAEDIHIRLEEAYRGKGIAQKFTTQYMALLKNMGVKSVGIDAALSDGGYAWARANFKFNARPKNLIERMEVMDPFIYNPKFDELLERLKTADIKDLPMPKEILGLKTDWRKSLSEERLHSFLTGDSRYPSYGADPYAVMRLANDINPNAKSLGELIMRGSRWTGSKQIGGNSVLKQFFDNSVGMGKSVFNKFKESRNMFQRRVFDGVANGMGYRIKGKDFAFQGFEQDFSELSDLLDINVVQLANKSDLEVPKGFVGASAPTPVALLEAALKIKPGNKKLQSMLDNFKEMKIGKKELRMVDNIAASISIDSNMKALNLENTDGFAMMLSSLAGNRRAKNIINKKTNVLQKIMNDRASSAKQKEMDELAEHQKQFGGYGDMADPSTIPMIHTSKYPIVRDKDGNINLYPLGQFNPKYARASVHFTEEAPVQSHLSGTWDSSETKVVSPLSSMISDNGLPANLYPLDSWWMRNPGQSVKLSNASVIRPFKDYKAYTEELVSRGLIEPGKMAPVIMTDPKTKDVLYAIKPEYSFVDRVQIQKALEAPYPRYKSDRIKGKEAELLDGLALDLAKKQLGINTQKSTIGEHQLYPDSRHKQLLATAQSLGVGADRYHTGKSVQRLESPFGLKDNYGEMSSRTKFSDFMESLRMSIIKGHFKTSTSLDGPFSDIHFRPKTAEELADLPEFANGGMVRRYANGGLVRGMMSIPEPAPKQFANGGMVRAAMGGMLINGKFLPGFAMGGMVPAKFAMGGYAMGTDTVPAMLTPGEFVIKKSAVDRIGPSALNKINGYAEGGLVGGMSTTSSDSVYNNNTYEINVNVSSNSNPDQIANAVMTKIRQIDNKRVRGSAF